MKKQKVAAWLLSLCLWAGLFVGGLGQTVLGQEKTTTRLTGAAGEPVKGSEHAVALEYADGAAMLGDMVLAAENDRYALYYHVGSLAIALKEKTTGALFFSNPFDASKDENANGDVEKDLESQLVLTYVDTQNVKTELYSSADCAELGQYTIIPYEDGVRMELSVGREQAKRMVPEVMTVTRFEALTAKMTSRAQRRMKMFYSKTSLSSIADEAERKRLLAAYPALQKQDLYLCMELSEREKDDVEGYLTEAGYTIAQYQQDNKSLGLKMEETYFANFRLAVEYKLTQDGMTVCIPNDSVQYDTDHFALLSVRLLAYFGADKPDKGGEGYLFIPDGSGALININGQEEDRRRVITGNVYGLDSAITQTVSDREGEQYLLPVFGIVRNDKTAAFAILESGDGHAQITARLGEPNGAWYTVYPTFYWTSEEFITVDTKVSSLNSAKKIYIYDSNVSKEDFVVSYHGLFGEAAGYSGMAALYHNYFTAHGMKNNKAADTLYMGLETLGTALYPKSFLGFSYQADATFTTYEQSAKLADYFKSKGIDKINLTLTGWQKDGLDARVANRLRISSALGGKNGFSVLTAWGKKNGVAVYPDVDLLFVGRDTWFDGFSRGADGARMLDHTYAGTARFEPDIQAFGDLRYAISPSRYQTYADRFFAGYETLNNQFVSLGTVGRYLTSNFNKSDASNRGETMQTIKKLLSGLSGQYQLAFDGGNAYVLPYASVVKNVPTGCSGYLGESASVPFLQLAVSGSVICQSAPINLSEDAQTQLLRCIESRTSPAFTLAADHVSRLKQTDHSTYYAVDFAALKEQVVTDYQMVSDALAKTEGSRIISHRIVAQGVSQTGYENGVQIYVNYNEVPFTGEGVTVPARGYLAAGSAATE